jgi:hypothetical protein
MFTIDFIVIIIILIFILLLLRRPTQPINPKHRLRGAVVGSLFRGLHFP